MIEWKEYKVGEVFECLSTKTREIIKYSQEGRTPFITGISINNGIEKYVFTNEELEKGNCITISSIDGSCFYQKQDFIGRGHGVVNRMYNENFNKNIALFVATILKKTIQNKYNYSNQCWLNELKNLFIILPTINNEIAWDLMDRYIRRLENKILDKKEINIEILNKPVDIPNWKEFNFFDIFDKNYQIGDSKKITTLEGDIALVSAGESNNGIDSFVKYNENNKLFNENQITLAKNGSVGTMNYQNQKFYATSDIMVLKLKDYELNKYIALFLKVFCEREFKLNYSWSNKITLKVLEKTKIQLPATQNGETDWQYMEDFMKNVEKEAIIN